MKPAIEKRPASSFRRANCGLRTDALRLCFARLATQSRDLRFDMTRVEEYRNFCNKLWNAARYVLMNVEGQDSGQRGAEFSLATADPLAPLRDSGARGIGIADYRLDGRRQCALRIYLA